jgi:hypothetical protein
MPPEPADSTRRWQGRSQKTPERRQLAGLVHVDPQEPGLGHRVLAPLRPGARGHAQERLLTRITVKPPIGVLPRDDPLWVVKQALEPLFGRGAGAPWKVMARVLPPIDVELPFG